MKFLVNLSFILISTNLYANSNLGFTHIKLTPAFVQKIHSEASNAQKSPSSKEKTNRTWKDDIVATVFGPEVLDQVQQRRNQKFTAEDSEQPLLFQTIRDYLGTQYQTIGQTESQRLNDFNQQFNLGTQNFSGFSWQKPFGGFHLHVDRQLSPDLFDDKKWIVQDTFTVQIEATTFLGKLAEGGVIDMSQSEIGAFAGINFTRTYYSYQYADSFMQALVSDFTPLFLPFMRMTPAHAWKLPPGNLIKREDQWQIGVGGIVETPSYYGFSFSGGVLAQFTHKSVTSLQVVTPREAVTKFERLRISHNSEKATSVGGALTLQLDLFKILKLTLLSGEFSFESDSSKEFQLSFEEKDQTMIELSHEKENEFKKLILNGNPEIKYLEPHVVRLDESEQKKSNSTLNLLIYSMLKKKNLEQIRLIKNQEVKTFFKSYSESIRLVQNLLSRLLSTAVYGLLKFTTSIKNDAQFSRKISIEYEATLPQSADPKTMSIEKSEQFSMNLVLSYEAARTHKWFQKKYKKDILKFYDQFTFLTPEYKKLIETDELRGPISITTMVRVNFEGLDFFNSIPIDQAFVSFANICGSKRATEWGEEAKRSLFLSRVQIGKEMCVKNVGSSYLKYKKIQQDLKRIDLAEFQHMIQILFKKTKNISYLKPLFGESLFIHGSLLATTSQGMPFQTHFKAGQFKGIGLIDNFKRQSGTRAPLSIFIE